MKNLVKRFGQFVNEGGDHHGFEWSQNVGDDNMLPRGEQEDAPEQCEKGCEEFDGNGKCIDCGHIKTVDAVLMDPNYEYEDDDHVDPEHKMNNIMFNHGQDFADSKINNRRLTERELYEAKKQEKIEALDAIDKKFAKMKPAKKSMPMKPMTKKNMEMEEEEEEETSMKPKMLFGKPVKSAKPETKTNKMPLKGGKPAFLFGKK